jgi:hypothetical protein
MKVSSHLVHSRDWYTPWSRADKPCCFRNVELCSNCTPLQSMPYDNVKFDYWSDSVSKQRGQYHNEKWTFAEESKVVPFIPLLVELSQLRGICTHNMVCIDWTIQFLSSFDFMSSFQEIWLWTERGHFSSQLTCRRLLSKAGGKNPRLVLGLGLRCGSSVGTEKVSRNPVGNSCVMVCHFAAQQLPLCMVFACKLHLGPRAIQPAHQSC